MEQLNGDDLYNIRLNASLEYTFHTNHTIKGTLPYALSLYNAGDARNAAYYSFGDITLSYEYLKQIKHINLFFGPQLTIPLAESNEYALREGVYAAGAGRYEAGFTFAVTGIRDPVVWTAGLDYMVGLPKKERFYTSWQPGTMQLSMSVSDLFNERFGFAIGAYQSIQLPQVNDGEWKVTDLSVSTFCRFEFLILFENDYVRVMADASLYPLNRPFVFGLVYGHRFELIARQD
jgi:hypothetical protein